MAKWYGITKWHPEDVLCAAEFAGIDMTLEQAADWWKEHEMDFRVRMIEAGNDILFNMLSEEA